MPSILDTALFNERLFFPQPDRVPPPAGAEDRFLEVPGGRVRVRLHPREGLRCVALLFPGNGEVASDYDKSAPRFAESGAAVAVVDYRGYGRSQGVPTLRVILSDALVIAGELSAATGLPLVVYGRSLGSACAAHLYGEDVPGLVACVWESGFTDLRGLVARRGMRPPDGFDEEARHTFDPLPKLARGKRPFLALHGEADTMIAPTESQAAFDAAGGSPKRFVLVPGRGHNDMGGSPVLWQGLRAFLGDVLGG